MQQSNDVDEGNGLSLLVGRGDSKSWVGLIIEGMMSWNRHARQAFENVLSYRRTLMMKPSSEEYKGWREDGNCGEPVEERVSAAHGPCVMYTCFGGLVPWSRLDNLVL